MRRLTAAALLLACAACVREPDPLEFTEPAFSVHGVVRAGETAVRVSLLRTLARGAPSETSGAEVTLSSGATTVRLTEVPGSQPGACYTPDFSPVESPLRGCYAATLPQPAAPGSRWQLTATLPAGEKATGSTVIPAPPAILSPAPGTRLVVSSRGFEAAEFDVAWQTPSAPRVEIRVAEGTAFRDGARVQGSTCMVAHRHVEAAVGQPSGSRRMYVDGVFCYHGPGGEMAWDSAVVPVLVTAFDSAYADFALHGRGVTRGHRSAALQGAYGVFGSAASTRREIIVIPRR
ncbi:MAG: DUF4249 family protein [Gemmatimonadetes bacterium]|nr:DUF4249 family protein [Gemmatimonadota bacterium]